MVSCLCVWGEGCGRKDIGTGGMMGALVTRVSWLIVGWWDDGGIGDPSELAECLTRVSWLIVDW